MADPTDRADSARAAIPDPVLVVEHLSVAFRGEDAVVHAVDDVSFAVAPGETLAIVGESGSGKTTIGLAILGLLDGRTQVTGRVQLDGRDLRTLAESELESVRGKQIAIVFQDSLAALNPVQRVGTQIAEAITVHESVGRAEARSRVIDLMGLVGLADPPRQVDQYPHELSGGMRQRVMIAMAIANDPAVLIADEPTSALDVTIQAQVLDVLERIQARTDTAIVLITHDLGVVAAMADRVMVLHEGRAVECADVDDVFYRPADPYTVGLLAAVPRLDRRAVRQPDRQPGPPPDPGRDPGTDDPLLEVTDLVKQFPIRGGIFRRPTGVVHAVDGVSFSLWRGETLGIVGESGCGKSTIGRAVLRLVEPTSGAVRFDGTDVVAASRRELRRLRARMQIVFQDPYASLDPRMSVAATIAEPMRIHDSYGTDGAVRVAELLAQVGLAPADGARFPHEFSGGERQRIGIARALSLEPDLLVLDEPVSALDVPIQAGILDLLGDLQAELGIAYLFIGHDLAVVRQICDQVAVMYLGRLVETGTADDIFERPAHPYTQALLSAVPIPDPDRERRRRRIVLEGDVPSAADPPTGCRFRTRCWKAQDVCAEIDPELIDRGQDHPVACHFAETQEVI